MLAFLVTHYSMSSIKSVPIFVSDFAEPVSVMWSIV